jgi:hypothetical protein
MGGFSVDPDELARQSSEFDELRNDVYRVYTALVQITDRCGDCWGNDEAGQAFAKNYVQGAVGVMDGLRLACGSLAGARVGGAVWAAGFARGDDAVASLVSG